MPSNKYILKDPTFRTQQRMQEVRFWLFISTLKDKRPNNIYVDNMIENLTLLHGCKITDINYAYEFLDTYANRPNKLDLALIHKYANIPVRTLTKITHIANQSVYSNLEKYINEESYDLIPRLSDDLIFQITQFNKGVVNMFNVVSHITKEDTRLD